MEAKPVILGPDSKPVESERYAPCPSCGRDPSKRVPSGGFGTPYLICVCGYEFKELKWKPTITS